MPLPATYDIMMRNIVQQYRDTRQIMESVRVTMQDKPQGRMQNSSSQKPVTHIDEVKEGHLSVVGSVLKNIRNL